jgi:hypothetical protein
VAVAVLPMPDVSAALPTAVPPDAHPEALANGPQAKKLTLPLGLPPVLFPLTVATSVFVPPSGIELLVGAEVVLVDALPTVKHSALDPSLDAP